ERGTPGEAKRDWSGKNQSLDAVGTVCMGVSVVSDEALLAGLATGDRDAAAGFVRRFQSRVYGLAVTILGDPTAAGDVAQDTFVRAWRHASTYDARRGAVASWLLTIARNQALDRARLTRSRPVDPDVLATQLATEKSRAQIDGAAVGTVKTRIRDGLGKLRSQLEVEDEST